MCGNVKQPGLIVYGTLGHDRVCSIIQCTMPTVHCTEGPYSALVWGIGVYGTVLCGA